MRAFRLLVAIGVLSLTGCAKEVGRIPFATEGTNEATMGLKAGLVELWVDLDVQWEGDAKLVHQVTLVQRFGIADVVTCSVLNPKVKVGWTETNVGASHSRKGMGKMSCVSTLGGGGPTTVKSTLVFSARPASLKLTKADIIVKQ